MFRVVRGLAWRLGEEGQRGEKAMEGVCRYNISVRDIQKHVVSA